MHEESANLGRFLRRVEQSGLAPGPLVAAIQGLALAPAAAAYEGQRGTLLPLGRDLARLFRTAPRQSMALGDTRERWRRAGREQVAALAQRLGALERSLLHLSPQAVLERGYSIVTTTDGAIVHDAGAIAIGVSIGIQFAHGEAEARVTRTP